MLMSQSVQLIQNLNELIKKYGSNDKVRKIVLDEFSKRNMRESNAVNILTGRLELNTLDIDTTKGLILLFAFTSGMYTALTYHEEESPETLGEKDEINEIIPSDYFTEIEIENFKDYKAEKKVNKKERYTFPNMIKVTDGYYKGIVSSQYLAKMDAGNDILYNFKNQRDPHIDIYGMKRIQLDKNKVERITNRLLSGTQFSDEIRLNLLHDGEDELYYDEKTGELTIISGTLNIFDGYHRLTANSLAITKNADLEFNWGLVVTNFSEKKTQEFMVQINEQKPMKQEHIKSMDASSLGNIVVDAIRDTDSEFATKIKDSDGELKFGGLTKKSILATSIEECYNDKLENRLQAKPIAKHIANVMDYIMGLKIEEFIVKPEETKKVSYINHKNMFVGYVALSERLFGLKNWEDKIEEVLSKIDFSKNNDFWNDNGIADNETDLKKKDRDGLYKYFRNLVN